MAKTSSTNWGNLEAPHPIIWTFIEYQNSTQHLQNNEEKQQENYAKIKLLVHTLSKVVGSSLSKVRKRKKL